MSRPGSPDLEEEERRAEEEEAARVAAAAAAAAARQANHMGPPPMGHSYNMGTENNDRLMYEENQMLRQEVQGLGAEMVRIREEMQRQMGAMDLLNLQRARQDFQLLSINNTNDITMESFKGDKDDEAQDWLKKFQNYAELKRLGPENMRRTFALLLKGEAGKWYARQSEDLQGDYDRLTSAFLEHFRDKTPKWVKREDVKTRKQKSDETIRDYTREMRQMASKCQMSKDDLLEYYIAGLKDEVKVFVYGQVPRTLEEAEEAAHLGASIQKHMPAKSTKTDEMVESVYKKINEMSLADQQPAQRRRRDNNQGRTTGGDLICQLCGRQGHGAWSCYNKTVNQINPFQGYEQFPQMQYGPPPPQMRGAGMGPQNGNAGPQQPNMSGPPQQQHRPNNGGQRQQAQRNNTQNRVSGGCFVCGAFDHFARECKQRRH